jgi:purine-binding chemotaxis protein CheW
MAGARRARGTTLDWADVRARVEAAGRAISGDLEPSPEEVREQLQERARHLARVLTAPRRHHQLEVVTFTLAGETYAIESRYVIEVFRLRELTPLPGARPPISGLTAWRGDLLVVLDLRAALGLPATSLNDLGRVVVLGRERHAFGILADAARDVAALDASGLRAPPEGSKAREGIVRGMTSDAVLLLDGDAVLRLLETDRSRRLEGSA